MSGRYVSSEPPSMWQHMSETFAEMCPGFFPAKRPGRHAAGVTP